MDEKQINKIIKKCTIILFIAIIFAWILFNEQDVKSMFNNMGNVLTPFLIGAFVALLINIPMTFFEKKLKSKNKNGIVKEHRPLAIALSVISIILVIMFVLVLIIPQLINVGVIFSNNIPIYQQQILELVNNLKSTYPDIDIQSIQDSILSNMDNIKNGLMQQVPNILTSSIEIITGTVNGIVNFFIGMAFAFLILTGKSKLKKGAAKVLYAYAKKEKSDKIIKYLRFFIDNFNKFIVAQCLNSIILGIACIVLFSIAGIPNSFQIGVLVGFTYLIPIVGIFIGIAIGSVLILSVSGIKTVIFLVITIIIWQICENFIKPVVIGKKTGISDFWLFVATIAGGAAFGIMGMIFAVPITNTLYAMVSDRVKELELNGEN